MHIFLQLAMLCFLKSALLGVFLMFHSSSEKIVDLGRLGRASYIVLFYFYLIRHLKISNFQTNCKTT